MNAMIISKITKKAEIVLLITLFLLQISPVLCLASATEAVQTDLEDGEYSINVKFEGGSGKAEIDSTAVLLVTEGHAYARVQWDSPNYDYMIVGGEKYFPVNEEGNATFEIPVTVFNKPMTVIGDTTAMSMPHEIEYQLTFDESSVTLGESTLSSAHILILIIFVLLAVATVFYFIYRGRRNRKKA